MGGLKGRSSRSHRVVGMRVGSLEVRGLVWGSFLAAGLPGVPGSRSCFLHFFDIVDYRLQSCSKTGSVAILSTKPQLTLSSPVDPHSLATPGGSAPALP